MEFITRNSLKKQAEKNNKNWIKQRKDKLKPCIINYISPPLKK
jgi:hypothetical protein